ncbi:tRNA1(Val) (adenine(37)-N6)-methyltransferase [Chitinophaga cymbidii]|uniref:tRNA1(Val) (adenine(37)-N6)-methyltransferase n=1 Tax=Chitinophaga cymbidii TaxID=1096750 RepID=A0A512RRC3_9BACT|nr:methyltransferase [Chitinophaga cymbidii]GEP98248.1 tRNA1(Val) (adenine(37)-N6)-methyltransferase [Chitinophaga cymbidii]
MGNTYFKFKQFTVHQQGSAMKVCTDACIQGAFTALHAGNAARVLDIGAGTGLLSLMLAQGMVDADPARPAPVHIDAIELDAAAATQARENFDASPWKDRLHLIRDDIRHYHPATQYPFIITNPPFFENDLKSPDHQRNAAMHAVSLDYEALLDAIRRLLTPDGRFSVLLPYEGFQRFRKLAADFVLQELLEIRQTPAHGYFRAVGIFGKSGTLHREELTIYDDQRQYTPAFIQLLKPYYLYL